MGGVESVDDMMMDMQEEFQLHDEVSNVLGQAIDPMIGVPIDEADLMKELEEMDNQNLSDKFDTAEGRKTSSKKPVPTKNPQAQEAEDLKKLEAELAGL